MNFMQSKSSIFSPGWTNLVFEELNKHYGAYILRRLHRHILGTAILITLIVLSGFLIALFIYNSVHSYSGPLYSVIPKGQIEFTAPPPVTFIPEVHEPVKQLVTAKPKEITNPVVVAKLPDDVSKPDPIPDDLLNQISLTGTSGTLDNQSSVEAAISGIASAAVQHNNIIIPDVFPSFKGGPEALSKYLKNNIRYPEIAKRNNTTGIVYVAFTVNANGSVTDIEISKGIGSGCDEEAMRVVKLMPDWKPGRQAGMAVPVRFNLPIKFSILK
ncbi:MAG TPA: TonB family protein [Bacteroidia bacterium]|nr:TonB family protein [Bacteroidia bacterium]